MRKSVYVLSVCAGLAITSPAWAQWTGASITDGDVRFQVPSGSTGAGTLPSSTTASGTSISADFRTTGAAGTDHVFTNWWWYRANGDTRERALSVPTAQQAAVVKTLTGTNQVDYTNIQPEATGNNAGLRFSMTWSVLDTDGAGGNQGRVLSTLTVINTAATAATAVNLFSYVDYFFAGQDANDFVAAGGAGFDGTGRFINVQDSVISTFGTMQHYGAGATAFGVGPFSAVGGQLGDTSVDDFTNFNNAITPADISGVLQWSFGDIPAGGSASATMTLAIPAPGALALLGLGGLVAGRRRR